MVMASSSWIQHVEGFVDSTRPANEQVANLDAITVLVKNGFLTIEGLVKEMEMYLTTTDNVLRARGILLLAELLARLASMPFNKATIHSLIGFFTSRLADWQALRGTLIGCLALLRRKDIVGMVLGSDAIKLAQSYLQNLQVQSLAQHDRMLCFELLESLLDVYPDAISTLGDDLVHGICEAIDEEKDPRCLMLTFHLVEILVRLFPDPDGPVATYAEELFELLGRYFPIYFTHQKNDDDDVKRDELSEALMRTFSSTPYFEPFCIPLLLDKLSSSLPSAKLDALKCLGNCAVTFGPARMKKHAKAIWVSLKDVIFTFSLQEPIPSVVSISPVTTGFRENGVAKEALICLKMVALVFDSSKDDAFFRLIVDDNDLDTVFASVTSYMSTKDIPQESERKLHALGSILSVSAKVSRSCCDRVFQKFFPRLMDILEIPSRGSLDWNSIGSCKLSSSSRFGALFLCIELLAAGRDFAVGSKEIPPESTLLQDTWFCMLQNFSGPLAFALGSFLVSSKCLVVKEVYENIEEVNVYSGVMGLQMLATFRGCFSPVSCIVFENILRIFMSIISSRSEEIFLWNLALKALVQIGASIETFHDSWKETMYTDTVIEQIVSLLSLNDSSLSRSLKLEAISEIGTIGQSFMSRVMQGLDEALCTNLLEAFVNGNPKSAEVLVDLLDCFSYKVLPWLQKTGGFDEVAVRFAVNIWNCMENSLTFDNGPLCQRLLESTMMAMKLAVGGCREENQCLIAANAYNILSSTTLCHLKDLMALSTPIQPKSLQTTSESIRASWKDEWLVCLFASIVIALRPETPLPNATATLKLFLVVLLLKGFDATAQALGSMVNKWPIKITKEVPGACTLEEALDTILEMGFRSVLDNGHLKENDDMDCSQVSLNKNILIQTHATVGLAWIAKGLVMRGHGKVKDVTMLLWKCLLSCRKMKFTPSDRVASGISIGQDLHSLMSRSAADAFHVIMSDVETSLNKKFHATIRPLYKQHFFSSMIPILLMSIKEADSKMTKSVLYRAFGHVISDTPLIALIAEARQIIPSLLDGLSILSQDIVNKDLIYSLLLALSGILTDENGREAIIENAHIIINHLIVLVTYPHMMIVRETAVQCLIAMAGLPYMRIYPMRAQVLKSISKALDDRKRQVRLEAVRCHQAWNLDTFLSDDYPALQQ